MHELLGALHIHTVYSDGTGTVAQVAAAAREAGLDWIVISDHDTLAALEHGQEGWYDGLHVSVGYEVTPPRNHYLVLGLRERISNKLPPAEVVRRVREAGGIGFVLHPDERTHSAYTRPFRWDDWSLRGFDGIELWNYMSDWIEHLTPANRFLLAFFPRLGIRGPTGATLAWWDHLNREGARTVGIGGVNVHATRVRLLWWTREIFPYARVFRTVTNLLLLPEPLDRDWARAREQIYRALKEGRCIVGNREEGEIRGSRFWLWRNGARWGVGETVPAGAGSVTLEVRLPRSARIRLLRDGEGVVERWGRHLVWEDPTPGRFYRAEAYRWGRPWIFTNPIWVEAEG